MKGGCFNLDPTCIYIHGKFKSAVWGRRAYGACFVWGRDLGVRTPHLNLSIELGTSIYYACFGLHFLTSLPTCLC